MDLEKVEEDSSLASGQHRQDDLNLDESTTFTHGGLGCEVGIIYIFLILPPVCVLLRPA